MRKNSLLGDIVIELTEIDSTNNYAMRLINEGMAEHGLTITANVQTAGRGQHGNVWVSEESKNLLMSVIVDTEHLAIEKQFYLNAMTALAISDLLMKNMAVKDVSIKWPNDIYTANKKISGILIENSIRGNSWSNAIIGIGLNVNQEKFQDLNRATSLRAATGKSYKLNLVLKSLLKYLNQYYQLLYGNEKELFALYNKMLFNIGKPIYFTKKHETYQGTIKGVNEMGKLLMEVNGKLKEFQHKEIELLIS